MTQKEYRYERLQNAFCRRLNNNRNLTNGDFKILYSQLRRMKQMKK